MSQSTEGDKIIKDLKAKAAKLLSATLGTTELKALSVGGEGNFPYCFEDPRNLEFNKKTYDWINCSLKADKDPRQLGDPFANIYETALTSISYSLSSDDQAKLSAASTAATNQQGTLLRQWKAAFGKFPDGDGQPIDKIVSEITTKWAKSPTDLDTISNARDLNQLLSKTPASGKPILPILAEWLDALGASVSLQNAVSLNAFYLRKAKAAVQTPNKKNNGMTLNDGTDTFHPRYKVSVDQDSILNGINESTNSVDMEMTVKRTTDNTYQVSREGGAYASFDVGSFFTLDIGGHSSYFKKEIATSSNTTTVKMKYPGVTLVTFKPTPFDKSTLEGWYWEKPITDAIKNTGKDVSGFKFNPNPDIDFSESGPFGYMEGVVISNYPEITITVKSESYSKIETETKKSGGIVITFLGIPIALGGGGDTYKKNITTNSTDQTVTIVLSPPKPTNATVNTEMTGWIMGAETVYPGTKV